MFKEREDVLLKKLLISAVDVCKDFMVNDTSTRILDQINLDIYEGDFTVIMGSSGAGKSTLLYALSGIDNITSGKVNYKNQEISSYNENQMANLRAKEFGFVFQQSNLVSNLTLYENILVAGYINKDIKPKEVQKRAEHLLNMMQVKKAKNNLPAQTSGGEAQRTAIARAIINNPNVVFADEPTGALNRKNSIEALDLLTKINEAGQSILMVTHDVHSAIRANRLLYMSDGKIIDEMILPTYKVSDIKKREEHVNSWLSSLEW